MALRSAAASVSRSSLHRMMNGAAPRSSLFARYSTDGRVLSEEERAKETVYIQVSLFRLIDFFFLIWVFFSSYSGV